jgi:5-methyltetrahydrofolate--homocysteine methyltransferase
MTPSEKIIDTAIKEQADFIGLSGLITPSLEEMVHVASEMERRKLTVPLLIGGATTSEIHTAVKIAPAYSGPVIHVKDASKAAGVLSSLKRKDKDDYIKSISEKYRKLREDHASKRTERNLISLEAARNNRLVTDWKNFSILKPQKPGCHLIKDIDIRTLTDYIDWTFFFFAWKLSGKYPAIFSDPVKGEEARKLFDDAKKYLNEIIDKKIVSARGIVGLYPATSDDDDVKVFKTIPPTPIKGEGKETKYIPPSPLKGGEKILHFLRNQELKEKGVPNLSLSDYIASELSGLTDHIGLFVVTADIDNEVYSKYRDDDYASIMIRILSDRLAEAAAEWIHEKVRKEYWGYAKDEKLTLDEMLAVKYKGIRPAPGYPACPDHTEKRVLFEILNAEKAIGVGLTENFAMIPPATVCGYIFSHPASSYFSIGKINRDQLEDYASRKKMTVGEASKWLAPNL